MVPSLITLIFYRKLKRDTFFLIWLIFAALMLMSTIGRVIY